jgi:hypothetical protein
MAPGLCACRSPTLSSGRTDRPANSTPVPRSRSRLLGGRKDPGALARRSHSSWIGGGRGGNWLSNSLSPLRESVAQRLAGAVALSETRQIRAYDPSRAPTRIGPGGQRQRESKAATRRDAPAIRIRIGRYEVSGLHPIWNSSPSETMGEPQSEGLL